MKPKLTLFLLAGLLLVCSPLLADYKDLNKKPVSNTSGASQTISSLESGGIHFQKVISHPGTTWASGQVALSTAAAVVRAADSTRRSVLIKNLDSSIVVYVGPTNGVTSSNGFPLNPNDAVTILSTGAVYAIAASGTPAVAYLTEND